MRKLSYLIIILGIAVMLFPKASEWYADYKQERLLQAAEHSFSEEEAGAVLNEDTDSQVMSGFERVSNLLEQGSISTDEDLLSSLPPTEEIATATATPAQATQVPKVAAIAVLSIDRIGLKLPVLEKATEYNMRQAAVRIEQTTPIGEIGNTGIAAHRARTKGRLFNRLDEIKVGDQIKIKTKTKSFVYTVYKTSIVKPNDVSVLSRNNRDRILTLITCDPIVNATHRLIVHAKLNE